MLLAFTAQPAHCPANSAGALSRSALYGRTVGLVVVVHGAPVSIQRQIRYRRLELRFFSAQLVLPHP
jgi:hypothetical protein